MADTRDFKTVLSNVTIKLPYDVALSAHAHLRLTDWLVNDSTEVAEQYKKMLIESWGEDLFSLIIDAVKRLGEEPRPLAREEIDD